MMTPQQALRVFVYADWAMLLVGVVALCMSVGWAIAAVFPRFKGRRERVLLRALICLLVFAIFGGTQASVLIAWFNHQWTPLRLVLFALPVVVMLLGLIGSIAYGARAVLRRSGIERRQAMLKALLGVAVFVVGAAPHTAVILIPVSPAGGVCDTIGGLRTISIPFYTGRCGSACASPGQ
jgi:MFS family permease